MGKTENMTCCECDRCGAKEYLVAGAPTAAEWHEARRVSADGVDVRRLLCDACWQDYRALASEQDAAFNGFMGRKG